MTTTAILAYPGAGKTWAVYEFIKLLRSELPQMEQVGRVGLVDYHAFNEVGIVIVGKYDGSTFQGTDRLSMAVAPHFEAFFADMNQRGMSHIIAEGDRINCMPFLKTAMFHGRLERIKLNPDPVTLRKQRDQRGHEFPVAFLRTVATKVDKHTFDLEFSNSNDLLEWMKKTKY